MQKLVTVTIDTNHLIKIPNVPFSVNDVDIINELLEAGWEIEEWDFLKEDAGDGQILLLVTLNDESMFEDDEDDFDFEEEEEDEDEDEGGFDFEGLKPVK